MKNEGTGPKRNLKGLVWIIGGLLLLAAALLLIGYNCLDAYLADKDAQYYAGILREDIQQYVSTGEPEDEFVPGNDQADRPMPVMMIGDEAYIGILEIPQYDLTLPVMEEWDYSKLKKAPCRYAGSYYAKNLVICGHNYARHFSNVKRLPEGAALRFTAADGIDYFYEVIRTETLKDTDVDRMVLQNSSTDWDLTLFTCTTGGKARAAVRCREVGQTTAPAPGTDTSAAY